MSRICVVEPSADKTGLANLCAAVGLNEPVPNDASIISVTVLADDNAWRMVIRGGQELYPAKRDGLARSLAAALGLAWVELQVEETTVTESEAIRSVEAQNAENHNAVSPVVSLGDTMSTSSTEKVPMDEACTTSSDPRIAGTPEETNADSFEETQRVASVELSESETGEAGPISDDEYMELLVQRMRESQAELQRESENGSRHLEETLLGQKMNQEPQPIKNIQDEERSVVVRGQVFNVNIRDMRSGRQLVSFDITDKQDSITAKIFAEEKDEWTSKLVSGMWLTLRGSVQYDKFTQELTLLPKDICTALPPVGRQDTADEKRIELHLHTKMSALDGVADIAGVIAQAKTWGHPAIAITDHGVVQAFPEAFMAGKKHNIKILYGVEGYLCDNPDERGRTSHIIALAATQEGLRNMYRLVSLAHIDYFYRRPRMPRSEIQRLRDGLIIGSACEAGEVYQAVLNGVTDEQLERIADFYDYLEIQPLTNTRFLVESGQLPDEEALRDINRRIVAVGRKLGKPVVATSDAHYIDPEDEIYRRILMAAHGFSDVENTAPLYLKTTQEMLEEFSYLGEEEAHRVVVVAPQEVASRIDDLRPIPEGFYPPELEGAAEQIRSMSEENARLLYGDPLPEPVQQRLQKELHSIIGNGFASLYLIAQKLVKKSVDDGYLVGSRGSVGSSLVARLCGISEVNPLPPHYVCHDCQYFEMINDGSVGSGPDLPTKNCPQCGKPLCADGFDIPFETFLGFEGDKTPDIDLNFSDEYQPRAHKYTEELFGEGHVFRAGTILGLADKTAFGYVRKYLDEKGIQARTAEINRLSLGITGVRKSTGQHPGGIMVVPQGREIYEFTPIQHPSNDKESGTITTHFQFTYVHDQLLKLDILGHNGPTMIRYLEEMTGLKAADIPLNDSSTMEIFSGLQTLGISPEEAGSTVGTLGLPEFNTGFVRRMLEDTRPQTFADLVRIMGLSHGTAVWLGNNQDLIKSGTITLAETIACRDDIMMYLIRKELPAKKAFKIMEQVRKGKGLKLEDEELMLEYHVPKWYIESCKKINYLFPKAHAAAYAVMAFWQAYYKVHYPLEFYAAYFSIRASDFDAQLIVQGDKAIKKTLKELAEKGNDATGKDKSMVTILEVVIEAMARNIHFLPVDIYLSDVHRFRPVDGKLRPPLISLQGVGESAAEAVAQARMDRPFTSVEDLRKRGGTSRAVVEVLSNHGALGDLPESDQLSLF